MRRKARGIFGASKMVTTSVIGFLVSLMGIGCFSCGAFALVYILSLFGFSSLIFSLPLHGAEFLLIGAVILTAMLYGLSKKLNDLPGRIV
jgi:hypothetical protein